MDVPNDSGINSAPLRARNAQGAGPRITDETGKWEVIGQPCTSPSALPGPNPPTGVPS